MKISSIRRVRQTTRYSNLKGKVVSAEMIANSLSAGSKKRLNQYMRNLTSTNGLDNRNFDVKVYELLQNYVWDRRAFQRQVDYLDSLQDEDGHPFSRNLKIFSTTEPAMQRFLDEDYTSFRWNKNYQKSLEEMKSEFSRLRLKPLVYNMDDDIINNLPKLDTHSGFTWILSGNKYKGENMEDIHNRFCSKAKQAVSEGTFSTPILLGFRTQASGEYEDDGTQTNKCKHKLRIVSMVDLMVIIAELMFSKPIQQYLSKCSYYAGGKNELAIEIQLNQWRLKYPKYMSIDYSSFDQTISSWLIEDAFSIVKEAFILNDYESKLFDVIVHDFIHKAFVIDGSVAYSDKGVPSGSMFTQIIDSLVNRLVVNTYFRSINESADMMIMGDDNIIFCKDHCKLEDISSYIAKNFGLIVKVDDKSSQGFTRKPQGVKFLSRFWTWDGEWRHPNQLISRLLYPERFRGYDDIIGPEHVIYAFILTYGLGMRKLIDVTKFCEDFPITRRFIEDNVGSRYLPGALAYIREYT